MGKAKGRGLVTHDSRSAYIEGLMSAEINRLRKLIDVDKLEKVGFNPVRYSYGECWAKVAAGEELVSFFAGCPQILARIREGAIGSIFLEMYPSNHAQYAFMGMENPEDVDVSNISADDFQLVDYDSVMKWVDLITAKRGSN
jgi:hypothetical protein